jgi:hypothetical protein
MSMMYDYNHMKYWFLVSSQALVLTKGRTVTVKLVGNAVGEDINEFRNHELPLDVYSRMYAH